MLVHTHHYSTQYRASHGLPDTARVEVYAVPGGYVFRTLEVHGHGGVVWQNSGGVPFETVEEALCFACQFVEYPEVAEYTTPLEPVGAS